MKTLIFLILTFFSLATIASEPIGHFQIDTSHSTLSQQEKEQNITGFISILPDFQQTHIKLESGDSTFESLEIFGSIENFLVKGRLYTLGKTEEITLQGSYYGMIEKEEGFQKIALKLSHENCVIRLFALKPTISASALHKKVENIIQ
jgi:hypothetical protein